MLLTPPMDSIPDSWPPARSIVMSVLPATSLICHRTASLSVTSTAGPVGATVDQLQLHPIADHRHDRKLLGPSEVLARKRASSGGHPDVHRRRARLQFQDRGVATVSRRTDDMVATPTRQTGTMVTVVVQRRPDHRDEPGDDKQGHHRPHDEGDRDDPRRPPDAVRPYAAEGSVCLVTLNHGGSDD
jgi:hypothetical protein